MHCMPNTSLLANDESELNLNNQSRMLRVEMLH